MKRGDVVTVIAGEHTGQTGRVICSFRGLLTVLQADGRAFDVPATECEVCGD